MSEEIKDYEKKLAEELLSELEVNESEGNSDSGKGSQETDEVLSKFVGMAYSGIDTVLKNNGLVGFEGVDVNSLNEVSCIVLKKYLSPALLKNSPEFVLAGTLGTVAYINYMAYSERVKDD